MRFAIADPPYPGQSAKHYGEHEDFAGEVDHAALVERLAEYDGWALHTSSPALREILPICSSDVRVLAWTKGFCAFKRNVSPAFAWEPIIVKIGRKAQPNRIDGIVMRDYIDEPITTKRGLVGAKPERVSWWLFEILGMEIEDDFDDLFPGSGAVYRAFETWRHYLARDESQLRFDEVA